MTASMMLKFPKHLFYVISYEDFSLTIYMDVVELNVNNLEISAQIKTSLQLINTFLIIQAQIYCSSSSKCHIFKHSILSHKILAFFVSRMCLFPLANRCEGNPLFPFFSNHFASFHFMN